MGGHRGERETHLAIAFIPGIPPWPFRRAALSGLGMPWGGMEPAFRRPAALGWWFICMNCMWLRCVGGGLYPLASRGDFSSLEISGGRRTRALER